MKWWTVEQLRISQDNEPRNPLHGMTFSLIETFYSDLKKKYPEASDFRCSLIEINGNKGSIDYWYELQILM